MFTRLKQHTLKLGVLAMLLSLSVGAHAELKKTLGNWDVHYIVFSTTFLTPEIAKANNITRSGKNALVNISVLDKRTNEAQVVEISGQAKNLLGTVKPLSFVQVKEGEAIYYLAQLNYQHHENFRFEIDIKQGKQQQTLQFQQKMYSE